MNKTINKTIKILAVIAVVQLMLTAMTWIGGSDLQEKTDRNTLLTFDKEQIDRITISGGDKKTTLSKKEGRWQTADEFPANQNKVDSLLSKLAGLKYSLPVATSSQALKRFKVADDHFERRIQLQQGGKTVSQLYLGSGAGARQVHARNGEQEAVYSVTMGTYDAPSNISEWQDKNVLQLDKNTVTGIELNGLNLQRDASYANASADNSKNAITIWKAKQLAKDKLINQKLINENLDKLLQLQFTEVLGKESKAEYGMDKAVLKLSVLHDKGKREYQLGKIHDSEDYVLKVSDRDEYFKIASFNGKPLAENFVKNKLLIDKPADDASEKLDADTESAKVKPNVSEKTAPTAAPASSVKPTLEQQQGGSKSTEEPDDD